MPGDFEVWSIVQFAPTSWVRQFVPLDLSGTPARIAAISTAAVVVAGAGGVAYAQAGTKVTLSIDGTTSSVTTFHDDVAGLLADQGVTVGARDIVAPAPSTTLHDGDTVVVKYARPFHLTLDGTPQTYWTTERSVDSALRVLGIRSETGRLSASRSQAIGRQGIRVELITPKRVTVKADGDKRAVVSTAASVEALLGELSLSVDADDIVSADLDSRFASGDTIVVKRVVVKTKTVRRSVDHDMVSVSTSDLYKGQSRVVKAGKDGVRRVVYRLTYVDGKLVKRTALRSKLVVAPVAGKREVGTKSRPSSSSSTPATGGGKASGLNWAALARCESGGNPRAVNPAGYYGLYQFSPATWRSVGGSGLPSNASASEQTARAQMLYNRTGPSSWPHCGKYLFT